MKNRKREGQDRALLGRQCASTAGWTRVFAMAMDELAVKSVAHALNGANIPLTVVARVKNEKQFNICTPIIGPRRDS
jgi:hypothetical protein